MNHYHGRYVVPTGETAERPYRWKNDEYSALVDKMGTMHPNNPAFMGTYLQAIEIWLKNLPDIPLLQSIFIVPVSTTNWKGWPDEKSPYVAPAMWHRGAATLVLSSLQPK